METRDYEQVRSHAQKTIGKLMKIIREEECKSIAEEQLRNEQNVITTRRQQRGSKSNLPQTARDAAWYKSDSAYVKELKEKIKIEMEGIMKDPSLD